MIELNFIFKGIKTNQVKIKHRKFSNYPIVYKAIFITKN